MRPFQELAAGRSGGQRERAQAKGLLEKAERRIDSLSEKDRDDVSKQMEEVCVAMTDRQWGKLKTACDELTDTLFYLEDA